MVVSQAEITLKYSIGGLQNSFVKALGSLNLLQSGHKLVGRSPRGHTAQASSQFRNLFNKEMLSLLSHFQAVKGMDGAYNLVARTLLILGALFPQSYYWRVKLFPVSGIVERNIIHKEGTVIIRFRSKRTLFQQMRFKCLDLREMLRFKGNSAYRIQFRTHKLY